MSTVFSEVYGTYYNVVAKVLTQALDGKLSAASMQQLVCEVLMATACCSFCLHLLTVHGNC